jgi:hypothetical protein
LEEKVKNIALPWQKLCQMDTSMDAIHPAFPVWHHQKNI